MRSVGNLAHSAYKVLVRKPERKEALGRTRDKLESNTEVDFKNKYM